MFPIWGPVPYYFGVSYIIVSRGKTWAGLLGAADGTAKQSSLLLTWLRRQAQDGGVMSPMGLLLFVGKIRRTGDFRGAA